MKRHLDDAAYVTLAAGVLTAAIAIRGAAEVRRIASKATQTHQEGQATQ